MGAANIGKPPKITRKLRDKIYTKYLKNWRIYNKFYDYREFDVSYNNIHYVITIDMKNHKMVECRAAQW